MPNYSDHSDVLKMLGDAQDADKDNRERAREAHLFVNKRDGQWEQYWWNANAGKPRYTFDMTGPVIDQISGEMEQADFDIKIKPAGGAATKDNAKILDGLVRNIETMSSASAIYNRAGRSMVTGGIDGWRVVQKYVDDNSFDQDLAIEPIGNFVDRVWFDPGSELPDRSDSRYAFVLQAFTKDEYEEKWPEGSGTSVSDNRNGEAYYNKADMIMVGELLYIKQKEREIVLMSNGAVYEADEDFKAVADDLAAAGVTESKRRKRKDNIVYSRLFDNSDWLSDEKETVFSYIPVVPTYGNFSVFENKILYWGAVEKLIDYQRVYNYAKSREIEEGALAPRAKYWMTETQAAGHEDTLATLNTNSDPVQVYNADPQAPGAPQQNGGAAINQGLMTVSESMRQGVATAAGLFAANMGDNPGLQSGVAIEKLQRKGDTGTIKYFSAQEAAISHTGRIIVDAIPKVYDTERQVRILKEDGSFDVATLNQRVIDAATGEIIELNDLSAGKYDVTCSAGPAFQNRQQETVSALVEVAQVDPSVIQMGGDVLLNNIAAPGMDLIAERKRAQLFQAGMIPQEQMTEQELQQMAAMQQQPQQPDAMMVAAQAELIKAQNEQQKTQISVQEKSANIQLAQQRESREDAKFAQSAQHDNITAAQNQEKLSQADQQAQFNQMMQMQQQQMAQNAAIIDAFQKQAETLKTLREAIGADTIVGPTNMEAYINQADQITESQERAGFEQDGDERE